MKITIKTLSGSKKEIFFQHMPNIRELRERISIELKASWHMFSIPNIRDKDDRSLGSIYMDDPSNEAFDTFIKSRKNNKNIEFKDLTFYIQFNLGPCLNNRPTRHNLWGTAAHWSEVKNFIEDPETLKFLKSSLNNTNEKYSEQLSKINFPLDKLSDQFFDPITEEIMNNPVIASDQRTYDKSTLEILNYKSPFSKELLTIIQPNLRLRSEIEDFIVAQKTESSPKEKISSELKELQLLYSYISKENSLLTTEMIQSYSSLIKTYPEYLKETLRLREGISKNNAIEVISCAIEEKKFQLEHHDIYENIKNDNERMLPVP